MNRIVEINFIQNDLSKRFAILRDNTRGEFY